MNPDRDNYVWLCLVFYINLNMTIVCLYYVSRQISTFILFVNLSQLQLYNKFMIHTSHKYIQISSNALWIFTAFWNTNTLYNIHKILRHYRLSNKTLWSIHNSLLNIFNSNIYSLSLVMYLDVLSIIVQNWGNHLKNIVCDFFVIIRLSRISILKLIWQYFKELHHFKCFCHEASKIHRLWNKIFQSGHITQLIIICLPRNAKCKIVYK